MTNSQGSYLMETVVDSLKTISDLDIELSFNNNGNSHIDGFIKLQNQSLPIQVKQKFRLSQLGLLLEQKNLYKNLILVANNLPDNIRQVLRENHINYLDNAGNIYFRVSNQPNQLISIFIESKKTAPKTNLDRDKAFTNTGLKVIFHLLIDENLINQTQRTIAETAQVSLNTVNKTLESLRLQGFIRFINKQTMQLDNRRKLYDKWSDLYENRLKPKHLISRFRFKNIDTQLNWRNLDLQNGSFWGGEPAADLITNYLSPQDFVLYTTLTRGDLMRKYHIIPDNNGNIFVYTQPFSDMGNNNCVHPLIAYADMVNTFSARNHEVAKIIETDYVQKYI